MLTILIIPPEIDYLVFPFMLVAAITIVLVSSRIPVYFLIFNGTAGHFVHLGMRGESTYNWIIHIGLAFGVIVAIEAILQLKQVAQRQITRLEIINEISRQIVLTLDTSQLLSLLNAAFQNALEADTYYIGIVEGPELRMQLFYDDGEYFNDLRVKREGLLSDWVIKNQQPLFLPDRRNDAKLEGMNFSLIGKNKPSISWVGVPMKATYVEGVMVIGSYQANAFDRSDLELLLNISQRAALALDNTFHHAHIQQEARLDSLTRVFNHGHFIQLLHAKAEECDLLKQPLSLIMLDIDHFKDYNDNFGHQLGDEVLIRLCEIIRGNIKGQDVVGRWGGEEFAVALPNTNGDQALEVARRIRAMLASLKLSGYEHLELPVPTISQGIAVYPLETSEVPKLIDLADKRLYLAKERGRDQIEPAPDPGPAGI
ncbi:MAG: GGDEF domain-containing protein [Chloroflexi bacterium]|nr:GGDEF domain-containing protein [Chloroflexota bacterium]